MASSVCRSFHIPARSRLLFLAKPSRLNGEFRGGQPRVRPEPCIAPDRVGAAPLAFTLTLQAKGSSRVPRHLGPNSAPPWASIPPAEPDGSATGFAPARPDAHRR